MDKKIPWTSNGGLPKGEWRDSNGLESGSKAARQPNLDGRARYWFRGGRTEWLEKQRSDSAARPLNGYSAALPGTHELGANGFSAELFSL